MTEKNEAEFLSNLSEFWIQDEYVDLAKSKEAESVKVD